MLCLKLKLDQREYEVQYTKYHKKLLKKDKYFLAAKWLIEAARSKKGASISLNS